MPDTANLLAYAYEIQAGDRLGDKTVKSMSEDGGTVTVVYKGGGTDDFDRDAEVSIVRELAKVPAWNPQPQPEDNPKSGG